MIEPPQTILIKGRSYEPIAQSNRIRLILNKRERKTLTHIRDNDKKPHRRERTAALLKVADGMSPHAVALSGLLQPRDPDTVYAWVVAFAQHGIKSLDHAPRRNRTSLTADEEAELRRIITEQSPQDYGLSRSRWTLANLRQVISIYKSLSGVWVATTSHSFQAWSRCGEKPGFRET